MPAYRLYFLDCKGAIQARQDFAAENDTQAEAISAWVWQACSDSYQGYELWEARRRVAPGHADDAAAPRPIEAAAADLQEQVLALEETLLDSHWRVARSERLLAMTLELRGFLARKPAPVPYQGIMRYVCAATGSAMMSLQLVEDGCLKLRGSRGFDGFFDEYFAVVDRDDCACGAALKNARQTVVPAIAFSSIYAGREALEVLRARAVVSCVSTPVPGRDGTIAGMFSILRREVWFPDDGELRRLDAIARQISAALADPLSAEARLMHQRG